MTRKVIISVFTGIRETKHQRFLYNNISQLLFRVYFYTSDLEHF